METIRASRNPVTRAFKVLSLMTEAPDKAWGIREIAKGISMHPSTVHRVLALLTDQNFVRQDPATGRYLLGLEFMRLAWRASSSKSLSAVAGPILRSLAVDTGETALLGIYDESRGRMMFVGQVESTHQLRVVRPLYEWMPIYGGSTGRALLAFLPEAVREEVLASTLEPMTPRTITDPAELRRQLGKVRERGYAVSRGERLPGAAGVAAPILTPSGSLLGVVGVAMPEPRLKEFDESRLAHSIQAAAHALAKEVGATDAPDSRS